MLKLYNNYFSQISNRGVFQPITGQMNAEVENVLGGEASEGALNDDVSLSGC